MRQRHAVVQHPAEVSATINLVGQAANALVGKVFAAGENSAKQKRGIDRRNLGLPEPIAAMNVDEVIEEAPLAQGRPIEKLQCPEHALLDLGALLILEFCAQAQCR